MFYTNVIKPSIFETNLFFLKKKNITFTEYASFYGSIKILNYLKKGNFSSSIWISSIHNQNIELLKKLQENKVLMSDEIYKSCLIESIKCHHIEILNFFRICFTQYKKVNLLSKSMKYYNFTDTLTYKNPEYSNFYELCANDYYILVINYLKNKGQISPFQKDEIYIMI